MSYVLIQVREKMRASSGTCEEGRVDEHGISKCDAVSERWKASAFRKGDGWA